MVEKSLSKEHKKNISLALRGHTVSLETRKKISLANSIALKGNIPWNKGNFKPLSICYICEKTLTKRVYTTCRKHVPRGAEWKNKISQAHRGKIQQSPSIETREKISRALKKIKYNPFGKTIRSIRHAIRDSFEMKIWKEAIFKRDNYTCVWCKKIGGKLNVDHIKMFAFNPSFRFEVSNGQTLCENCHKWKTFWDMSIYYWGKKLPELNIV